jgi:hypothetical protein
VVQEQSEVCTCLSRWPSGDIQTQTDVLLVSRDNRIVWLRPGKMEMETVRHVFYVILSREKSILSMLAGNKSHVKSSLLLQKRASLALSEPPPGQNVPSPMTAPYWPGLRTQVR